MTSKCPLKRKVTDIRFRYGEKAAAFFLENPICFSCKETRLLLLNIHHTHGKKINKFKTLCFHCHMIEHSPKIANSTFSSCQNKYAEKESLKTSKEEIILTSLNKGISIRNIIKNENTCIRTIHNVMKRNGFICSERKKPWKIDEG